MGDYSVYQALCITPPHRPGWSWDPAEQARRDAEAARLNSERIAAAAAEYRRTAEIWGVDVG